MDSALALQVNSILSFKAPHIVDRIAEDEQVSTDEAQNRFDECLKFLALSVIDPGRSHTPSEKVDSAWHAFLLFTRDYREFCQQFLGKFIDHVPKQKVLVHDAYLRTIVLIKEHFGSANPLYWAESKLADCGECCDGGCGDGPSCGSSEPEESEPGKGIVETIIDIVTGKE